MQEEIFSAGRGQVILGRLGDPSEAKETWFSSDRCMPQHSSPKFRQHIENFSLAVILLLQITLSLYVLHAHLSPRDNFRVFVDTPN